MVLLLIFVILCLFSSILLFSLFQTLPFYFIHSYHFHFNPRSSLFDFNHPSPLHFKLNLFRSEFSHPYPSFLFNLPSSPLHFTHPYPLYFNPHPSSLNFSHPSFYFSFYPFYFYLFFFWQFFIWFFLAFFFSSCLFALSHLFSIFPTYPIYSPHILFFLLLSLSLSLISFTLVFCYHFFTFLSFCIFQLNLSVWTELRLTLY